MSKIIPIVKDEIYINKETGEIHNIRTTEKEIRRVKPFWKAYLENVVPVLEAIGNKQIKIWCYIVRNMDIKHNTFEKTYVDIKKDLKINESTIAVTMKKLQEMKFIRLIHGGKWVISSDMFFKGEEWKRYEIMREFNEGE